MAGYFLSYARSDQDVALAFADALIAEGVGLWIDQRHIRPSEHWDRAVETALRASDGVVVMLSPRAAASSNVADEISVAVDAKKQLIPVMIEACTPPLRLTRVQFIDATGDRDAALARCLAAIRGGPVASPPSLAAAILPAAALAEAEQRLRPHVGPIAAELVRRAAGRAGSLDELRDHLASHLPEAERGDFLRAAAAEPPPPEPPSPRVNAIPREALDALTHALVPHLGPVAKLLVGREAASAGSLAELRERLAARIPTPADRARFLRQA